ncbi:MAG: PAS domain-containing sensor histidine kinase [Clostridiales bacterium]|nr:PAS domain-containing sensor histidine kinase [Clostridiales bacterium]
MTKRIFRTVFFVAVSVFLASVALFMTVLYDYFSAVGQNQLKMQTELAAQGVQHEGSGYFEALETKNYRITWIGTDGKVLYDSASDADAMENHFEREEVKEALAEGYGQSARYSSTLTERYLYSAKRLPDGTVIRMSVTQNSLLVLTLGMLQPIFVIFAVVIVLSVILASRLSKKIVKPLNELNLDEPLSNEEYDELSPLLRRIDSQQKEIKRQKRKLERKQSEFDAVIKEMSEGIVLLNSQGMILALNRAAAELLEADTFDTGKDILTVNRRSELTELLRKAQNGEHSETVMDFKSGIYQLSASPVVSDGKVIGTVLLMFDATEKEKNEQIRREFTANVSHELKTPLHAILGSAELMTNGMVKTEDIPAFSGRIYTQTQRMIRLVEDIIKLSHLDEGAGDMKREETDLLCIADGVVESLKPEAEISGVTIELKGEKAVIQGIPQLLESIVYNLCDNAIKYNRKGGSVSVEVKNENGFAVLTVADTGIGIPPEHQQRIFERFYRVDKSHSKEIGGTGLGLSIVKHAARLHGAEIDLQSVIDGGTTVTVKFPKKG